MDTSTPSCLRRRRWSVVLLVGLLGACGDDVGELGDSSSSSTDVASSDEGDASTLSVDDTTAQPDETTAAVDSSSTADASSSSSDEASRNGAPQANDDVFFVRRDDTPLHTDAAAGVLANDVDPDGDPLTVVAADAASTAGGSVGVIASGAVSYEPPAGYWGPDGFDYTVVDDEGEMAGAHVSIFVTPVLIPLSAVTAGTGGFTMVGEHILDHAGRSVSHAGDVNGDGLADVLVGAHLADFSASQSGRSYLVFGRAETATIDLEDIAAGDGGFAIDGAALDDQSGAAVSGAGDVNGDGLADMIVGARNSNANGQHAGRSYVIFGKVDTAAIDLAAIASGNGGFAIDGEAPLDTSGDTVSGAGDVNGDGLADVIVGATYATANAIESGRSYVVFGKVDTDTVELADVVAGVGGFAIDGEALDDRTGEVSGAGDVDGDGLADLVVGTGGSDVNGDYSGRAYVVFGKVDTDTVELADVAAGSGGFAMNGELPNNYAGSEVSGAGDVDGDGLADVIVGAFGAGRSYIVFGRADTSVVELADIAAGVGGFLIDADYQVDTVGGAGDVNGDGLSDVIVGVPDVMFGSGRIYVVFGKDDTAAIDLDAISAGIGGFAMDSEEPGSFAGTAVGGSGDVDGDGLADVIVGAEYFADIGRSYVVFGVRTEPL